MEGCSNTRDCPCTYPCPRHGKCCDCVAHHREHNEGVPACFFSPEAEVIDYGVRFIHIVTPFYLMICFNQIYAGVLRGIGDATMPTVIMLISFVVFRQIYLAVTKALGAGFIAVALAYPVGWILCSTLLIIRYLRSPLNSKT